MRPSLDLICEYAQAALAGRPTPPELSDPLTDAVEEMDES